MIYNNKIEAIKAVRALAHKISVAQNDRCEWVLQPSSDLRTAKELVEAIMELGAQEARVETERLRSRVRAALEEDIRF